MQALLGPVGAVVESHAVEVGDADDGLEEVPGRVAGEDAEEGEEAQGAPGELNGCVRGGGRLWTKCNRFFKR
jgi:hypothetical protein